MQTADFRTFVFASAVPETVSWSFKHANREGIWQRGTNLAGHVLASLQSSAAQRAAKIRNLRGPNIILLVALSVTYNESLRRDSLYCIIEIQFCSSLSASTL